jgi:hypothetical protein
MARAPLSEIIRELCDLLDQQMNAVSNRGLRDLPPDELREYERRSKRIAELRSGLDTFH